MKAANETFWLFAGSGGGLTLGAAGISAAGEAGGAATNALAGADDEAGSTNNQGQRRGDTTGDFIDSLFRPRLIPPKAVIPQSL